MKRGKLVISLLKLLLMVGMMGVSASSLEVSRASSLIPDRFENPPGVLHSQIGNGLELAPATPIWQQVNQDGFGDPDASEVSALAAFNGYLYAGTTNPIDGARIFRSSDGVTWAPVTDPGFGIAHDIRPPAILDMLVFKNRLYASTGQGDGPAQIWRTVNGVNWAPMTITGFSNPDTVDITPFAEYEGWIYTGASNLISGAQIWRSMSGDNNTWTKVFPGQLQAAAGGLTGMAVFASALYAAVDSEWSAQIWCSSDGGSWTAVMNNGFGDPANTTTGGMAVFGSYLYVGAGNTNEGAQLWRTEDGISWEPAIDPGFGDVNNKKVEMVFVFENLLYAGVTNTQTGLELWRSSDGLVWEQINLDGFGDADNTVTNASNAVAEFLGDLYVGTSNDVDGGELWRLEGQTSPPTPPGPTPPPSRQYLPLTLRSP